MKKPQTSSKRPPAATVDEYIEAAPEEMRPVLESLRQAIKEAAPLAEEVISYRIPTYKHHGPLVHFAAFKDHCSFITVNEGVIAPCKDALKGYTISGTTIHIKPGKPLPAAVVKKIVRARLKENESLAGEKAG